jgi:hypothetical protein
MPSWLHKLGAVLGPVMVASATPLTHLLPPGALANISIVTGLAITLVTSVRKALGLETQKP